MHPLARLLAAALALMLVLLPVEESEQLADPEEEPGGLALGITHTQFSADPWNDLASVAFAKVVLGGSTIYQNQHIMGWGSREHTADIP